VKWQTNYIWIVAISLKLIFLTYPQPKVPKIIVRWDDVQKKRLILASEVLLLCIENDMKVFAGILCFE